MTGRMPLLAPEKRARLTEWLARFATDFAQTPEGRRHAAQYEINRAEGVANFVDIRRLVSQGDDATHEILRRLFPHSHGFDQLPVWLHVAPTVTGDMRVKYEAKGWVKPDEWPEVARLVWEFFESCERAPDRLADWCARFVASPRHKGIQAAFLSPMLHALHPDRFAIINKKPLALLRWVHERPFNARIRNYPETNQAVLALAEELAPELSAAVPDALAPADALDMFCHWLVVSKRLETPVYRQPEDELDEEDLVVAENPAETAELEKILFPKRTPRVWLVATGRKAEAWPLFQQESCAAISMTGLGELLALPSREAVTHALRSLPRANAEVEPRNDSLACWQLSRELRVGDLVIAKEGRGRLLGVGVVNGPYTFAAAAVDYQHRIPVRWLKTGDWRLPDDPLPIKTLTEVEPSPFLDKLAACVGGFPPRFGTTPYSDSDSVAAPAADSHTQSAAAPARAPRHWWMNFNPDHFDIESKPDGFVEPYTLLNANGRPRNLPESFETARPGDRVIGYSTSPRMRAAVLCEITRARHEHPTQGPAIEFRRVRALKRAVSREELLADERLHEVGALKNPRGSLFPLTPAEYDAILDLAEGDETAVRPYTADDALAELFMSREKLDEILRQLRRRLNLVLQGPPGVGKTFAARRLAYLLLGAADDSRIELVQFHPSTSYEDFVLGLRPDGKGGFALKPGVFHRFCRRAQSDPHRPYVFIIDEINRGNLARILGELMMLIEHDKRGERFALPLAYGGEHDGRFYLPANLHLIGTMNTADRSLALVDYALRRRFAFVSLDPDLGDAFRATLLTRGCTPAVLDRLCRRVAALNAEICKDARSLGRGYQIGHSFFCGGETIADSEAWYREIVEFELRPLLEEYWMDAPAKAAEETANLLRA